MYSRANDWAVYHIPGSSELVFRICRRNWIHAWHARHGTVYYSAARLLGGAGSAGKASQHQHQRPTTKRTRTSPLEESTARFAGLRRYRQDAAKRCQCFKMCARTLASLTRLMISQRLRDMRASSLQARTSLPLHISHCPSHRHGRCKIVPELWSESETERKGRPRSAGHPSARSARLRCMANKRLEGPSWW